MGVAGQTPSLTVAFCRVSVGSALKHYTQMTRMPQGATPLSEPVRFRDRLTHHRLYKLNLDLLLETSVRETPVLLRILERLADKHGSK
jgi:uncharacterized protein with HEPN domain